MIVREVPKNGTQPREERIAVLVEVVGIQWLRGLGTLRVDDTGVYAGDELVATIESE